MQSFEKASKKEIPALAQLINSAYRGDSARQGWTHEADLLGGIRIDEAGLTAIVENPESAIYFYPNNEPAIEACVYTHLYPNYLYVGMVTVLPTLQGKGMGKLLLAHTETVAKAAGLQRIRMTVINTRLELIAFYNRQGYLPTGETEPWKDDIHIGEKKTDFCFLVLEKKL